MTIVKSPKRLSSPQEHPCVFLAGSIDSGGAQDWQSVMENLLAHLDITIFNPRRNDWDTSWDQDIANEIFRNQVTWELDYLEASDWILFYFDPETKAPITLMELGLFAKSGRCLVCCPEGYWRSGNVHILCQRYGISLVDNLDQLAELADQHIAKSKSKSRVIIND